MNTRWGRDEYDGLHVYDPVYPNRCMLFLPPSPTSPTFSDGCSDGEPEEDAERSSLGDKFPRYFSRNATQEMMEFLEAPGDEFALETSDDSNTLVAEDGDAVLSCEHGVLDGNSPAGRQSHQSLSSSAEPASSKLHDASRGGKSSHLTFTKGFNSKAKADQINNGIPDSRLTPDFYPMPGISAAAAPSGPHPYSFAGRSGRPKDQEIGIGRTKTAPGAPLRPLRRSQLRQGSSYSMEAPSGGSTGTSYSPPRQEDIDRYAKKSLPPLPQPRRSTHDKVSTPPMSKGVSSSKSTAGNKDMRFVKPRSAPTPPIRLPSLKSIGSGGLLKRRLLRREHRNLSADVKAL